ncbi:MAG: hypothetical protein ACAH80_13585 [Alphaproteobacteria bacterium]
MKHEHTRSWFSLKMKLKGIRKLFNVTVRPYNAETTKKHKQDISWSHGFTHFEVREAGQPGFERIHPTGCSGTHWFEENAKPLKPLKPLKSERLAAAAAAEEASTTIKLLKPIEFKAPGI